MFYKDTVHLLRSKSTEVEKYTFKHDVFFRYTGISKINLSYSSTTL